jgi:hypothetical protein
VGDNLIGRISLAALIAAAAASLAGCGTAPRPFSIEEKIWFDKATGCDILPCPESFPEYMHLAPPGRHGYPPSFAPDPPVRYRG